MNIPDDVFAEELRRRAIYNPAALAGMYANATAGTPCEACIKPVRGQMQLKQTLEQPAEVERRRVAGFQPVV